MRNTEEHPRTHDRFSALFVRDFRIFWTGQVISFSGSWMQSIAQGWLVYDLTKSPFYLGLVAAAASVPVLLFTLIGGVVADRVPKKRLLLATQTLSMIPALLLGVLIQLKIVTVGEIVGIAFFLGLVNAFDIPGRQSFLSEMVQKGHLMNAIALNSAAFNGARIIGPVVAGITIASVGVAACFYVNAASFLAAIVALMMIKGRKSEVPRLTEKRTMKGNILALTRDLYEGLRFVKREKNIFGIMLLVATFSLFGIPFVTFLPVFAEDILKVGPRGLGFLAGSSGVGALIAALLIAYIGDLQKKGRFMFVASLAFSISLFAFSLSRNYDLSAVTLTLAGWGMVSFLAVGNSSIQLTTPDDLRGRVMSVYALVFLGIAPLGNAVMGFVAHAVG
ncbi:MAG TPA: MFS transporter, partial [Thermodesulfovibrionales bacterium]|nr:MFS transporter [Thermodesulfovibrionales bacterium]